MTSESSAEKLLALAGKVYGGVLIRYFEALLEGSGVGGQTSHLSIIAFHRVEPTVPSNSQRTSEQPH
jgi:hypothetical protein